MALSIDQLSALTKRYFMPKLVDNIFNSNAFWQRAKSGGMYQSVDGGTDLRVPLAFASTTAAGFFSGSQTLDTTDNEQFTDAVFDWKQAFANISIKRVDELKNKGNAQVIDFVKAKVEMAEKTLKDTLGTSLYSDGSDVKGLVGLRAVIDTNNTYGGIDRSTNSWWEAVEDTTTTSISIATLRGAVGDVTIDSDSTTVHYTTQNLYDSYYTLLQPQQRFSDSKTADGGFKNILFEGNPIIVDSHVPADHWFGLNEKYIMLKYHPDENFRFEPFKQPTNQAVSYAKIYWMGALCTNNSRMQFGFKALTS